jgi:protease-4
MNKTLKQLLLGIISNLLTITALTLFIIVTVIVIVSPYLINDEEKITEVPNGTYLIININNSISENYDYTFPNFKDGFKIKSSIYDYLRKIEIAAKDPNIKGIILSYESSNIGISKLEEIRTALLKFKKSKKEVISYSSVYDEKIYYLASIADKVYITPQGFIEFNGLVAGIPYIKDLLDKVGIKPILVKHGKYKSAAEPLLHQHMSAENELQTKEYLNSIWEVIVKAISKDRNIEEKALNKFADNLEIKTIQNAKEKGLIDKIIYQDQLKDILNEKNKLSLIDINKYEPAELIKSYEDKIAIIFANGEIVDNGNGEDPMHAISPKLFNKIFKEVREDNDIKAVVLRINSPGGSAMASELILREIKLTEKVKPVIVSMSDYAASGGYYLATGGEYIFANKTTITGSIGVFGLMFNIEQLNSKLGINYETIKTNKYADFPNLTKELAPKETALLKANIEQTYNTFLKHVAESRKLTIDEVDKIAQGRVWTGNQAIKIGLVDKIGTLSDAIEYAKKKANIQNYSVYTFPQNELYNFIKTELLTQGYTKLYENILGIKPPKFIYELERIKNYSKVQVRAITCEIK